MSANPKFKADFSTKEAFLASLWDAYEHAQREENVAATKGPYPKRFQNTRDQFYETGVPMADHTYAGIIDRNDGMLARNGTMKFLIGMRSYMKAHTDNQSPREWYGVFDDAFATGQISIMAWGAAARQIYVSHGPHPADAWRFHAETLDRFRLAPRESLMLPDEIQRFNALPDPIVLYRGSVTPSDAIGAQGISWTTVEKEARFYPAVRKAVGALMLSPGESRAKGEQRVVCARVPKEAIFAVASAFLSSEEILVDYERITSDMMVPLPTRPPMTPADALLDQAFQMHRRFLDGMMRR